MDAINKELGMHAVPPSKEVETDLTWQLVLIRQPMLSSSSLTYIGM